MLRIKNRQYMRDLANCQIWFHTNNSGYATHHYMCVFVCMCVRVYYVCVHVWKCVCVCCVWKCVEVCVYMYMCAYVCMCVCICVLVPLT